MKKKLLLFLFAMAGVGSAYAASDIIVPTALNDQGRSVVIPDGVKDATESALFAKSANWQDVAIVAATLPEGCPDNQSADKWAAGATPTITYDGTTTLATGTAVGRWTSFNTRDSIYFYIEVYKQTPSNHGVKDAWAEGCDAPATCLPYYAGDAVEIYLSTSTRSLSKHKQYGIGYTADTETAASKNYGGEKIAAKSMGIKTYTTGLGANGDKAGWILEVMISLANYSVTETNNKLTLEVSIAQEGIQNTPSCERGGTFGRRSLVNSFSNSSQNYANADNYKMAVLEFTETKSDPVDVYATCNDIIIDGNANDAIWNSAKFAPKFVITAQDSTMASRYTNEGNPLGEIQTNDNNCLNGQQLAPGCEGNLKRNDKIAEWQVVKKGINEGADVDSVYFLVKVYDNDPFLDPQNSWISDAIELYLLVEEGGKQKINQYFIRYNELTAVGHYGSYDKIVNLKQSEGQGYWMVEFVIASNADSKLVGLDETTPNIKAELAIDMVTGGCGCRLGQIFTWQRWEYNWSTMLQDEAAQQAAIAKMQKLVINNAPKTESLLDRCGYTVSAEGMTIAKVEQADVTGAWVEATKEGDLYVPTYNTKYRAIDADGIVACTSYGVDSIYKPSFTVTPEDIAPIAIGSSVKLVATASEETESYEPEWSWKLNGADLLKEKDKLVSEYNFKGETAGENVFDISLSTYQGCSETLQRTIVVKADKISIPTAINLDIEEYSIFKPYDDNNNGQYGKPTNVELHIFNRMGVEIYDWEGAYDDAKWWNGCWNNNTSKPVDPGVYFYVLKLDDETARGAIEVIKRK